MRSQLSTAVTDALDTAKLGLTRLASVDFTKLDMSRLDVSKLDLPRIDLPQLALPDLSAVDLPAGIDRVVDAARDTAYAGIGAAVITVQRVDAEVRRVLKRAA